jgi:tetratricopeptide (TPR) repeat protein
MALTAAFVAAAAVVARAQGALDPQVAKGIAQVQDGYLEDGVATLAEVGRRLSAVADRRDELAQVYLWLGIAQAQLDSAGAARFSFREALRLDRRVRLAEGRPPKVVRLFASAQEDYPDQSPDQFAQAEASHRDAVRLKPTDATACAQLAALLYLTGRATFDETVASWEGCLPLSPDEATTRLLLAGGYWDRAYHDATFDALRKERYADAGLAQAERAPALRPDSLDALVYKGLFLRI